MVTLLILAAGFLSCPPPAAAQTPAPTIEYYHLDALGSVRAVTDYAGVEIRRHELLPFGEEWTEDGTPGPDEKLLFTGKERDTETGLDYFGARYYRADIGRFTTIDPLLTFKENLVDPQRWNRYTYARNNPLKYVDPDGKDVVPVYVPRNGRLKLEFLDSRVAERIAGALVAAAETGERIDVSEGFRTPADQQRLMDLMKALFRMLGIPDSLKVDNK